MFKKSLTLILVLLMVSPIFTMPHETALTSTQATPQKSDAIVAETDLARVTLEANIFPNDGLEEWSNPHQPTDFSTSRSEETDAWIESTIFSEGSHSIGLEARAINTYQSVDTYLIYQSRPTYDNPINLTLDLDWYLDSIGTPENQDYVRIDVNINYKHMFYYLGCETDYTNYTSNAYFEISGTLQTWNHLQRNLTQDYIEMFGEVPTQYRETEWNIRTYSAMQYIRVYFDDLNLVNGTTTIYGGSIGEGNFETMGDWQTGWHYGAGDIAQCSDSNSGSSSMNLTALTFDDRAWADAYRSPDKLLTSDNQANLSFWWKLDDYVNPSMSTYARVTVSFENMTFQSDFYYYMFVGGSGTLPFINMGNNMKFAADSFNVTDTWNFFDRNLWEDFNSVYSSENLWISQIRFEVDNNEDDSKLSLLVDDITFAPSILNDMDYEQQNAIGQPIQGWDYPPGLDEFTVTDFAESGGKAANLTLMDDYTYLDQDMHEIPIDSTTELIFDFNVYIDTFNTSSEDYVLFEFYFDEVAFSYIIANSTSAFEDEIGGEEDAKFIILQDTLVTGEWLNFQLDIVHDYELLFGSLPDTIIYDVNLLAEAVAGSKLEVYFDDLYIYYDPSPEITDVSHSPVAPLDGGFALIAATVVDATIDTVSVNYRVDNGSWSVLTMNQISSTSFQANLTDLIEGSVVEYSVTAIDAFDKSVESLNGTEFYSFTVGSAPTSTPTITGDPGAIAAILIAVVILAVGAVFLLYMFVIKKK